MSKLGKLFAYGSLVRAQTGKSMLRQALEIFELSRGRFKLGVEEYYELGVFDDTIFSEQVKTRCVGWRGSATIDRVLNDDYWRAAANDKVLNYALLVHYGFPVPETLATYSPSGRKIANECLLRTEDELRRYLSADLFFLYLSNRFMVLMVEERFVYRAL